MLRKWLLLDKGVICLPIKPIDYQVMIPRTLEAAKVSNDAAQKYQLIQQHQAEVTRNKAEDSLRQVYSRSNAEQVRITDKQKDERQNDQNKKNDDNKKKNRNNTADKRSLNNIRKTSTIDIRI